MIGIGRLGGALAIALDRTGFVLDLLVFRRDRPGLAYFREDAGQEGRLVQINEIDRIESDVLIIATPDGSIASVAEALSGKLSSQTVALHTSGALSSAVLLPLQTGGNPTGSIHPLVSISDPISGAAQFSGAYFCIEGSPEALPAAAEITERLGGVGFTIASRHKPLYHAAAAIASGHVTALLETSVECLVECGVERSFARGMLVPLVRSTVENFSSKKAEDALTGPFARADLETVKSHLRAIESSGPPGTMEIYLGLGRKVIELAEKAGIDTDRAAELRELINIAKEKSR